MIRKVKSSHIINKFEWLLEGIITNETNRVPPCCIIHM